MRYYVNANALSCLEKFYTLSEELQEVKAHVYGALAEE